jgi:hypothetical protein
MQLPTCPAQTGPVWKDDAEVHGCILPEGHELLPLGQTINGIEARDHRCSCGAWWVDSIRRDKPSLQRF